MSLAALLVEKRVLTREQADQAAQEQRATGDRLDRVLRRLNLIEPDRLLRLVGEQLGMEVLDLPAVKPEAAVLALLPPKLVHRLGCVPIATTGRTLTVATSDPFDPTLADELRLASGRPISLALADEDDLRTFIRTHYGVGSATLDELSAGLPEEAQAAKAQDDAELAQDASVIKLVNDLLLEAVAQRATDIHLEPFERDLAVRYRIDGLLERANTPASINRFAKAIVSRIKIMASLNVAEKRLPQDGRIAFRAGKHELDLRVSIIPMLFGEGVVIRVLDKAAVLLGLSDLGMPDAILHPWAELIARPHGILLVTGPTGSGKSTTLYASLNRIAKDDVKVITVEDPVEYHVPGVNQIQTHARVGLDFAAGMRAILRHDPDVVMIGEIRDKETAQTAVQASLTGHLVLSTLHTNDAPSATTRLLDIGVEPYLVASSLEAALAQRLVRRVCPACAAPALLDEHQRAALPSGFDLPEGQPLTRGVGCRACRNTGYRGRVGIYELLRLSDTTRELVTHRKSSNELAHAAERAGELFTLKKDGFAKARAGLTTVEEVVGAIAT
jgi:general secretion pathway protein E/type IV pilus assembly protein PilB